MDSWLEELIQSGEKGDLHIDLVKGLLQKEDPEWEKVSGVNLGAAGPAYACQIELPGEITLDIVLVGYTEYMEDISPGEKRKAQEGPAQPSKGSYRLCQWQLIVAEGDEIRTNLKDNGQFPTSPVKDLFDAVENRYKDQNSLDEEPGAERTRRIVVQYLAGEIN